MAPAVHLDTLGAPGAQAIAMDVAPGILPAPIGGLWHTTRSISSHRIHVSRAVHCCRILWGSNQFGNASAIVQQSNMKLLHQILPVVSLVMTHPRRPYPGYKTPMVGTPQATNLRMTGIHNHSPMAGPSKSGYFGAQAQATPGAPQMHQPSHTQLENQG